MDTLRIGTDLSYQMKNLVLPTLANTYNIGDLVEIEFDNANLTLLDTTILLSFIDSVFIELTDHSKAFIVSSAKIDSTVDYKANIPRFSYYHVQAISKMDLSEKLPQIRFKWHRSARQTMFLLKVEIVFKLSRITGYVF